MNNSLQEKKFNMKNQIINYRINVILYAILSLIAGFSYLNNKNPLVIAIFIIVYTAYNFYYYKHGDLIAKQRDQRERE